MSLRGRKVTVLGAGVAGLAVARILALRGAEVEVLDQADAIREVGAGLQISPNGAVVLRAMGLGAQLDKISTRAQAVELRDGYNNRLVTRLDVAGLRPKQGWHLLHRADLISLLLDGARDAGVQLRLLQKAEAVDLSGQRPALQMCTGAVEEADILIGADGLHSPTRRALNGADTPFFTGQVAWRMVIPATPGDASVSQIHMGAGRHIVTYPLRGGSLRNIVAVEERSRWVAEGWAMGDDPLEMRLAFESFGPRVQGWLEQAQEDSLGLWGLFRHPVAQHWWRALPWGRVAMIGDAAHPTLPFLAQGANMALEDAWSLADALEEGDLGAWQAARAPRCRAIVEAANKSARAYHLSGPSRWLGHKILQYGGKIAPGLALSRFDWIYNHDVTAPSRG